MAFAATLEDRRRFDGERSGCDPHGGRPRNRSAKQGIPIEGEGDEVPPRAQAKARGVKGSDPFADPRIPFDPKGGHRYVIGPGLTGQRFDLAFGGQKTSFGSIPAQGAAVTHDALQPEVLGVDPGNLQGDRGALGGGRGKGLGFEFPARGGGVSDINIEGSRGGLEVGFKIPGFFVRGEGDKGYILIDISKSAAQGVARRTLKVVQGKRLGDGMQADDVGAIDQYALPGL